MDVRDKDNFESWIRFFLQGVANVAEEACQTSYRIIRLKDNDRKKINEVYKESSKASLFHDRMFARPIISIKDITKIMNTTFPTANDICAKLVKLGILKEITGKERNKLFAYEDYLDILKQGVTKKNDKI